jgi:hypothetical protein
MNYGYILIIKVGNLEIINKNIKHLCLGDGAEALGGYIINIEEGFLPGGALDFPGFLIGGGLILNTGKNLLQKKKKKCFWKN